MWNLYRSKDPTHVRSSFAVLDGDGGRLFNVPTMYIYDYVCYLKMV
jgi:hypothetical protein